MIAKQRFLVSGLSRLTVRVTRSLYERDAEIVVLADPKEDGLASLLDGRVRLVSAVGDRDEVLLDAGLAEASCFLALGDDDLDNLSAAVSAHAVAPDVPIVIRAFDPALVDQLEQGLNIRRAFSVSALAAPAFVAAALGEEVVETLRLGEEDVPLCHLTLRPGSPLAGKTAMEVKAKSDCAVIASSDSASRWTPATGDGPRVEGGNGLMVGGRLLDVLRFASGNSAVMAGEGHPGSAPRRIGARGGLLSRVRRGVRVPRAAGTGAGTLLPITALVLVVLLAISVVVFAATLDKGPVDAIYFAITTALGNSTLDDSQSWLKLFGVGTMVAGGALLGVVFSYLASVATASRLEERMGRRARRLSGHVVVAGLGTIGYRIERTLFELGIPVAVIDRSPDPRFVDAVGERVPVLSGDVRLPENLERAGLDDAFCFVAVTDDDLTNVVACMEARRLNPSVRTVARIFDERLAERVGGAFGIDAAVSATRVAAEAFVGAATDERALRSFRIGEHDYLALRHTFEAGLGAADLTAWRGAGIRILAFSRPGSREVEPPSALPSSLNEGVMAILAGPASVIRARVLG